MTDINAPIVLNLNPMGILIANAELQIDRMFNNAAAESMQKDQEYKVKRDTAKLVLQEGEESSTPEFSAEARLMNISIIDLANSVVSKPDTIAIRGLQRRSIILSARESKSEEDLKAVMNHCKLIASGVVDAQPNIS